VKNNMDKKEVREFVIEVYEVHAQKFTVEATSQKEAVEKYRQGEGVAVDGGLDFIMVDEERGAFGLGIRSIDDIPWDVLEPDIEE